MPFSLQNCFMSWLSNSLPLSVKISWIAIGEKILSKGIQYIFSTFAVKRKDMYKLCVMVNEIYCPFVLAVLYRHRSSFQSSPSNQFQAKREMFELAAVVSTVLLCLLLFSVPHEICIFSQICPQLLDLPQCSFL